MSTQLRTVIRCHVDRGGRPRIRPSPDELDGRPTDRVLGHLRDAGAVPITGRPPPSTTPVAVEGSGPPRRRTIDVMSPWTSGSPVISAAIDLFPPRFVEDDGERLPGIAPIRVDMLGQGYCCHSEWFYDKSPGECTVTPADRICCHRAAIRRPLPAADDAHRDQCPRIRVRQRVVDAVRA